MSSSQMIVFNDFIMPVIAEQLPQRIAALNEAAPGIMLSSAGFVGDFFEQSFYNALHDNRRRVDPYSTNNTVAPVDLTQDQHNTVKVHGGFGPIRFEPKQMMILQKPTQEGVVIIASQFVDAFIADQLNTSVAACVAAIANNAALVHDTSTATGTGSLSLSQSGLNRSHAKMGDSSQSLVIQIMRGAMDGYHGFVDEALANGERLFTSANVTVIDILGKRTIVSDIPALTADAGATAKVLTLTSGGIMVDSQQLPYTNIETKNGDDRIVTTWQTDYDYSIGLKGYSWDEANGGKAPSDAALETGSNWDKVMEDKFTAGVLYIADVA